MWGYGEGVSAAGITRASYKGFPESSRKHEAQLPPTFGTCAEGGRFVLGAVRVEAEGVTVYGKEEKTARGTFFTCGGNGTLGGQGESISTFGVI